MKSLVILVTISISLINAGETACLFHILIQSSVKPAGIDDKILAMEYGTILSL
jgi:hypothetical protein